MYLASRLFDGCAVVSGVCLALAFAGVVLLVVRAKVFPPPPMPLPPSVQAEIDADNARMDARLERARQAADDLIRARARRAGTDPEAAIRESREREAREDLERRVKQLERELEREGR
jgi:hypothetical protein